ncbi:hypothetical protein BDZ45DRAFT_694449 [Acephala macrosclerotiorum]|nr:hypothetical protein BDZ45DRAFT_694449 [Acephala macrosclerotiorum]
MPVCTVLFWLVATFSHATTSTPFTPDHKTYTPPTRLLHQFPLGTWVENLAVRSNGQLLVTLFSTPDLYIIDPFKSTPPILEKPHQTLPSLGQSTLHHASLSSNPNYTALSLLPTISKITNLPTLIFPNGMSALDQKEVLIGDITRGKIYSLNTNTGSYFSAISNNLTEAVSQPIFGSVGVNGIHVRDNVLYYANTGLETFGKVPIHGNGTVAGESTIISHTLDGDYYDDFALDREGEFAYLVTGSGNSVERVKLDGSGRQKVIVGSSNSTLLAEPTAVAFGRTESDRDVLYVVTAGGLATPVIEGGEKVVVGGQVVAVDLKEFTNQASCWLPGC